MLVSSQVLRNSYLPDGIVKEFPYSFPILESSHIKVVKEVTIVDPISLATTKSTEEIPISDYTVLGAGDEQGGTIVFNVPPANGVPITILRNTPFVQLYKYTELDNFPAESHENALSLHVMMCLQILEIISRAIVLPETSTEKPSDLLSNFYEMYETVKIADEKLSTALQNLFTQVIQTFTTQDGVLEYELGTDYVDPNSNNLLLVMDHVVQQPDVAYKIIAPNKIAFTSNPGAGHEVWGISSLSFANPDIKAVITKAISDIQDSATSWISSITQTGAEQAQAVVDKGAEQVQRAKAWAESGTPPDPADENSKSAKEWAMIAGDVIPIATGTSLGKVKLGETITGKEDGTIDVAEAVLNDIDNNTGNITYLQNTKLDKTALSDAINSASRTNAASSAAVNDLRKQSMAFPSLDYIDIQLDWQTVTNSNKIGTYVAPADGYIMMDVVLNSVTNSVTQDGDNIYITIIKKNSEGENIVVFADSRTCWSRQYPAITAPVRKGNIFNVAINGYLAKTHFVKFVYAEGALL